MIILSTTGRVKGKKMALINYYPLQLKLSAFLKWKIERPLPPQQFTRQQLEAFSAFGANAIKAIFNGQRWVPGRGPTYPHLPLHVSRRASAVRPSRVSCAVPCGLVCALVFALEVERLSSYYSFFYTN